LFTNNGTFPGPPAGAVGATTKAPLRSVEPFASTLGALGRQAWIVCPISLAKSDAIRESASVNRLRLRTHPARMRWRQAETALHTHHQRATPLPRSVATGARWNLLLPRPLLAEPRAPRGWGKSLCPCVSCLHYED